MRDLFTFRRVGRWFRVHEDSLRPWLILLGFIAWFLGYLVLSSLWYGYALSIVWNWFIPRVFHVAQISIPAAMGLALVINMFVSRQESQPKKSDGKFMEAFIKAMCASFVYPLFVLGLGYLIHLFV